MAPTNDMIFARAGDDLIANITGRLRTARTGLRPVEAALGGISALVESCHTDGPLTGQTLAGDLRTAQLMTWHFRGVSARPGASSSRNYRPTRERVLGLRGSTMVFYRSSIRATGARAGRRSGSAGDHRKPPHLHRVSRSPARYLSRAVSLRRSADTATASQTRSPLR